MAWFIAGLEIVPRNYALIVNGFLWTILALIFIIMRLYTRATIVKRVGMDDWLMTGAMASSIAFFVTVMYQVKYGLGQPVNLATLKPFLAALFSTVPLYNVTQTLYKLSITTQSYRLFTTEGGKKIMKFLIGWVTVCGIMSISGSLFYCRPIPKAWDDSIDGHCINRPAMNYSISGFNIVNDLTLMMIPIPFLMKLQLPKRQRIVLISVFACGAIVTVVSIVRLKSLYDNLSGPVELQPITGVDIALWSGLEINVAIICGSVPALKAFVSKVIMGNSHGASHDYAMNNSTNRKQSQVLRSRHDEEQGISPGSSTMKIKVEQSIEMKAYSSADDNGSETDLIVNDVYAPAMGNSTRVNGPRAGQLPPA